MSNYRMTCLSAVVAGAMVVCIEAEAIAQQSTALNQMYGQGVHAFFSRNYSSARDKFTSAISQGSRDPRNYYFRAMANLRMGYQGEARSDMSLGAQLESRDPSYSRAVGRSLQRVQGRDRMMLEQERQKARVNAYAVRKARERQRYEALQRREQDVLRRPSGTAPLDQFAPRIERPLPLGATEERLGPPLETPEKIPAEAADPLDAQPPTQPEALPAQDDSESMDLEDVEPVEALEDEATDDTSDPFPDDPEGEGESIFDDEPVEDDDISEAEADDEEAADEGEVELFTDEEDDEEADFDIEE